MKILTVLLVLLASQVLLSNCYSQVKKTVSSDGDFSTLTTADRQYDREVKDLARSHDAKLQALKFSYLADLEALQKKQIELLETGKSAAMQNEDLDAAIAIRDRIAEVRSAKPAPLNVTIKTNFSTVWVWDRFPDWKLVFEGDDTWMEGERSRWTETGRSTDCIYLHDEERNMHGMLYANSFFYREDLVNSWTMVTGSWLRNNIQLEADLSGDVR